MTSWRLATRILASGLALALLAPGSAQMASAAVASGSAAPGPHVSYAQRLASAKVMVNGDSIASFFLSLASDPAKNFIMDQIGLPTTASKLRDLSDKINAIQQQLAAFQIQVTALIAQLSLDARVDKANAAIAGLDTFYRDHFVVLSTDLVQLKLARDKVPPDPTAVAAALAQYDTDKATFISTANSQALNSRIKLVNTAFEPGSGATGLTRAVGESLLSKYQYLDLAASKAEHAIYVYYEEYQALAAWLTCEWEIARGHTELVPAVVNEFTKAVDQQRDSSSENGLPPLMPEFTVLDRGSNPAQILDSRNKLMFTNTGVQNAIWTPAGGSTELMQVPRIAQIYNTDLVFDGFRDWEVPNQAQVYGLFDQLGPARDRTSISDYLSRIGLGSGGVGPFIWTRDAAHRTVRFRRGGSDEKVTIYEGISTSDLRADERPRLCSDPICTLVDRAQLISSFNLAQGHVFLERNVGATRYF